MQIHRPNRLKVKCRLTVCKISKFLPLYISVKHFYEFYIYIHILYMYSNTFNRWNSLLQ
jgi:hypothetical protein